MMKTYKKVLWIIGGLVIFAGGCCVENNGVAMIVSLMGACVMMVGLLPIIDKQLNNELKIASEKKKVEA